MVAVATAAPAPLPAEPLEHASESALATTPPDFGRCSRLRWPAARQARHLTALAQARVEKAAAREELKLFKRLAPAPLRHRPVRLITAR